MKPLAKILAAVLAVSIAAQPAFAAVASVQVQVGVQTGIPVGPLGSLGQGVSAPALAGESTASSLSMDLGRSALPQVSAITPISRTDGTPASAAVRSGAVSKTGALGSSPMAAALSARTDIRTPQTPRAALDRKLHAISAVISEAGKDLPTLSEGGAHAAVEKQFAALAGETRTGAGALETPVVAAGATTLGRSGISLKKAAEKTAARTQAPTAEAEAPAKFSQVFKDPERNRSFWRYLIGNTLYLFGVKMYVVGLPFLISSLTKNSLSDNHDARAASAEAVKALIRENRSLARIAHWVAQGVGYIALPFFAKNAEQGPKKLLLRTALIRTGILALIPTLFFATGVMGVQAALWTFMGLIAAHSFVLGIYSTMDKASVAIILGDKSVTTAERVKANSLLTLTASFVAILAPAIAGQISLVGKLFGKDGPGGAVIYGFYAAAVGLAGLIYSGISLLANKAAPRTAAAGEAAPADAVKGGTFKNLWTSLRDGFKLIWNNRVLRVMMFMNLISFLFADPLTFNVLPEFAETIIKSSASLGALFDVPVLGWLLHGLTSTPMGYFGMMGAVAAAGYIAATLVMEPLRKLFTRLGFKTEEGLMIPFTVLGLIEIPLFWVMLHTPSMWAILGLYALQAFVSGGMTVMFAGVNQKALGAHKPGDVNKIVATQSLMLIVAAIASTYLYGFVLTGIPIGVGMLIAFGVTALLNLFRAASPWLLFSKEQRQGQ